MRYVIGVSDMKLSGSPGDILVTHALGSCIGISIHDPIARVGGILHYMLPLSKTDEEKASRNPCMFGDTGIPYLFHEAYRLGARKENIRVVIAGGARVIASSDMFDIGKRNIVIARKMFWKSNVLIDTEDVGGTSPRTLYLEVGSGHTWYTSYGTVTEL
jgi:chemotaxis protein CheD